MIVDEVRLSSVKGRALGLGLVDAKLDHGQANITIRIRRQIVDIPLIGRKLHRHVGQGHALGAQQLCLDGIADTSSTRCLATIERTRSWWGRRRLPNWCRAG